MQNTANPSSTGTGASPATAIAPRLRGSSVPISPSAPLTSLTQSFRVVSMLAPVPPVSLTWQLVRRYKPLAPIHGYRIPPSPRPNKQNAHCRQRPAAAAWPAQNSGDGAWPGRNVPLQRNKRQPLPACRRLNANADIRLTLPDG